MRMCAGRSLLEWTCRAAQAAESIDRLILSTDDARIAEAGCRLGAEVPFLRPARLAADETPMLPVLQHLLEHLEREGEAIEALVLLQPTSPLRVAADIDGAVGLLCDGGADSVVTVMPVPGACRPEKLMARADDGAVVRCEAALEALPRGLVVRNGPAVVVTRPQVLRGGALYGERTLAYEMPAERSIDIDTPYDFLVADLLLSYRERGSRSEKPP